MGGKHKQAQRTKNNARPSSSGRTAELLGRVPTTPFIGFPASKDGAPIIPGFSLLSEEGDPGIDANFQLVFKKMNKKDATTKLKALQEFSTLCVESEGDAVTSILPFWPRLYSLLAVDIEHRVREAAHVAHKAVISQVKRAIAPYFKHIAGVWFTSQYDTYPPAASAAVLAFQEAFSPTKVTEAIIFAQNEILLYIYDNLVNQTAQTLSNPKTTSPEDMEAKYERIIVSSLNGYAAYLSKLTSEQLQNAEEANKKLVSSSKFWKFSKHKSPLIRFSFFQVISALCQHGKFLLQGESNHLSNVVFNQLDESDPSVLPVIWDTALHVLLSLDTCWSEGNVEKKLLPKLHYILKEGGKGNAKTIFPNLLPLLSKIPIDMDNKLSFYNKFFDNIRIGMDQKSVNQSHMEGKIVATTFMECFKYVIMVNNKEANIVEELITNQLVLVIEKYLNDTNLHAKSTAAPLFSQIGNLIHFWSRNNNDYNAALNKFWNSLDILTQKIVRPEDTILKNLLDFILYLKDPEKFIERKNSKVKFADESEGEKKVFCKEQINMMELSNFVKNISFIFFDNTSANNIYLTYLLIFLREFDSADILNYISEKYKVTLSDLFEICQKWLVDNIKKEEIITLSFEIMKHITDIDDKEIVYLSIMDLWSCEELAVDIVRNIMQHMDDVTFRNVVKHDKLFDLTVQICNDIVSGRRTNGCYVLRMLYGRCDEKGDFLLTPQQTSDLLDILTPHINDSSSNSLKTLGAFFINCLSGSYCTSSYEALIFTIFEVSFTTELKWANGINKLMCRMDFEERLPSLVEKIAAKCRQAILKYDINRIIENIKQFLNCFKHTEELNESEFQKISDILKIFLKPSKLLWIQKLKYLSTLGNYNIKHTLKLLNEQPTQNIIFTNVDLQLQNTVLEIHNNSIVLKLHVDKLSHVLIYYKTFKFHVKDQEQEIDSLEYLLKWNEFVCQLLKFIAIKPHHKYEIEEDHGKIRFYLPEDQVVEDNFIFPFFYYLWDVVYCIGLLENFAKNYPYTQEYKIFFPLIENQKEMLKEVIDSLNMVELSFFRQSCHYFLHTCPDWLLISTTLQPLLCETDAVVTDWQLPVLSFDEFDEINLTASLLTYYVENNPEQLQTKHWDFVFIQTDKWISKFLSHPTDIFEQNHQTLQNISALAKLFSTSFKCFRDNHLRDETARVDPLICQSWNEIVKKDIWNKYFKLWLTVIDKFYGLTEFTPEICKVIELISDNVLLDLSLRDNDGLAESVELSKTCYTYILSRNIVIQYTAFKILLSLVPDLIQVDTEAFQIKMAETSPEENSLYKYQTGCKWTCTNLRQVFTDTQMIVDTLLSDFKLGDHCIVEPFTDSYSYTHACLLLWCVILDMCAEAHPQLKYQYANWLKETGFSANILQSVFKLMPRRIIYLIENRENSQQYFESFCNLDLCSPVTSQRIEHLSCFVYRMCLQRLPAIVRQWWSELDNKSSGLVDKVTSTYVSPILIANELKNVQDHDRNFDKMEIKIYPNAREVRGIYMVDEAKMDVVITLPTNFPLGNVQIDSSSLIVSSAKWRNWLFKISMYLLHENSSIFQSLIIWKNNLDKKFEGVEECYICYSILQGNNYEIPKTSCRNCKKKYHMSCLYKWFSTSAKSTCPLCRNLF